MSWPVKDRQGNTVGTYEPEKGSFTLNSATEGLDGARTRQQPELGPYLSRLEWEAERMAGEGETVTVARVQGSQPPGNWLRVHGKAGAPSPEWALCLFEDGGWILDVTSSGAEFDARPRVAPTTASQHVTATTEALIFARLLGVIGADEAPAKSSEPNVVTDTCTL